MYGDGGRKSRTLKCCFSAGNFKEELKEAKCETHGRHACHWCGISRRMKITEAIFGVDAHAAKTAISRRMKMAKSAFSG
ncbi:MAG: hypothetical protein ACPLSY_11130 [Moorellaceae bacterium]